MNKRVNYMELLKESVADPHTADHDTSKAVDVKGPFLDPILSYDGGGELPTHKDAACREQQQENAEYAFAHVVLHSLD